VYEREGVTTTPSGGSAATVDYQNNLGYQYTQIGTPTLSWDANGQMTAWGSTGYSWTALGQMSQVAVSGEITRDYTYDAFGRRVKTLVGSAETQMLYHGWHMVGAFDVAGSQWQWQEVPLNRGEGMLEHVSLDTNDMDGNQVTNEYLGYAVHEDWQNTVWGLSDTAGAITERYVQDNPFGASHTLDSSATDIGSFASAVYHHKRMHGGVVEPVSGLYDFRNRWYSPVSGSWLSRDPLFAVNFYDGLLGNPVRNRDIFGLRVYFPCPAPPNRANRRASNGEYDQSDVDDINSATACCGTIALLKLLGVDCDVSQKCEDACSALESKMDKCNDYGGRLRNILESTRAWRRAIKDGNISYGDDIALGGVLINLSVNHWDTMSSYIAASSVGLTAAAEAVRTNKCCPVNCSISLPSWATPTDPEGPPSNFLRGESRNAD
jgi:RHS repeat-associated protein